MGGGEAQWANLDKSKSIQFYQTNVTNVAKILLLQVFLNIRRKLFDFQTFMIQTHIINYTDIIIYFTDTYYLYYRCLGGLPVMWASKLLLPPKILGMYGPKYALLGT